MVNLDTVKNTNYVANSYAASTSKSKGGYIGIIVDSNDYILEASMANVGVVLKNGKLIIPSFERTLAGTTVVLAIKYIENNLLKNGAIEEFSREDVLVETIKNEAKELMLFGGNNVVPILSLDGVQISEKPGPVAKALLAFLNQTACV
mmetsp:Transcript_8063/g.9148  ORF Transcript_8063/g.9148 Transcript_8063/m.9148 type:complete len:148 (-) Transcript_8063:45-488(-)|eukprot:CAMPEP_0168333746 /NCGR_PEP_ID=MMETSP0213-20121227/9802_1 /TAXON_ID=151035 /ORGANISM="Euplotes harpa, Strain FSP1.4" /LENGTH=147 /DNA_ID=CAMNT_0008338151 /DNA_START=542 /DNA_END=985 /DNA_ORIENTATION=-